MLSCGTSFRNQARVEEIFVKALKRAQKRGELSDKEDPPRWAGFFMVTIQGMRSMARLKSDRKASGTSGASRTERIYLIGGLIASRGGVPKCSPA